MSHNILYLDSAQGYFGGGQVSLLELVRRVEPFSNNNYHPIVVVSEKGNLSKQLAHNGIEHYVIEIPSLFSFPPTKIFNSLRAINHIIKKFRIALIHANSSRSAIYGALLPTYNKIPLIWHVRIPHRDKLFIDNILLRVSDAVIAVSDAVVKNRFSRRNASYKNKIHTIYNGVEIPPIEDTGKRTELRRTLRQHYTINEDDIVICTIGRLSPEKGMEYLIKAIALNKKLRDNTKVRLLIVGEGTPAHINSLKNLTSSFRLNHKVIFAGFVEDIYSAIVMSDIYCLPSLTEGFNRTLIETMATGLVPVIATEVGGNPEAITNGINGILIPPRNINALAEKILYLTNNPEKAKELSSAARNTVREKFSIEKNVSLTIELYEKILSNKNHYEISN